MFFPVGYTQHRTRHAPAPCAAQWPAERAARAGTSRASRPGRAKRHLMGCSCARKSSAWSSCCPPNVLGEFLSPDNAPMHFRDFVERAQAHNLRFLCEADLGASIGEMLYPAVADHITAQAGSDRMAEEQYRTLSRGGRFADRS